MPEAAMTVEKLYELCEVLDAAKENVAEKEAEFTSILSGTKAGLNEKKLTSQLIVRYFHKFPALREPALDAVFELCEDDDVNIRKFVIRNLATLCKESGPHVSKVADVLTQLLQTEDAEEQKLVQNALTQLLGKFPKETLATIFGHILNTEAAEGADLIRERGIKFLALKLKTLPAAVAGTEIQDFIVEQSKKVLNDVTGDEFVLLMHILSSLACMQSVQGRKSLLDLVTKQAHLEAPFDATDSDRVDQICQCTKQAIPFLSKNVPSTPFMTFLVGKVFPVLGQIGGEAAAATRLELLRVTAELAPGCGTLEEEMETKLGGVFTELMRHLPLPPSQEENGSAGEKKEEPQIAFSEVEALLITFHQLAKRHPDFLGSPSEARTEELRDFRKRLAYVARVIQLYTKNIQAALKALPKEDLAKEENKLKILAMRTTGNINTLLKDLLHVSNLTYRSSVSPSWKPVGPDAAKARPEGRKLIGAPEGASPPKRSRTDQSSQQSYYHPPSGKFSEKAGSFPGTLALNPHPSLTTMPTYFRARGRRPRGTGRPRRTRTRRQALLQPLLSRPSSLRFPRHSPRPSSLPPPLTLSFSSLLSAAERTSGPRAPHKLLYYHQVSNSFDSLRTGLD